MTGSHTLLLPGNPFVVICPTCAAGPLQPCRDRDHPDRALIHLARWQLIGIANPTEEQIELAQALLAKPVHLVVPEPDLPLGKKPITTLLIAPEGADLDREVPGFFIIQIDGEPIWPGDGAKPKDKPIPRQFLSLSAVYDYLAAQYRWTAPLAVTSYARITPGGPRDFPAIWGADRKIGKRRVQVRVRYLGSFRYWNGRRVDPTKVGTPQESIHH